MPVAAVMPLDAAAVATPRTTLELPRAFWLGVVALAAFGVTLALAMTMFDRFGAPEGSGLIVVQAPNPSPAVLPYASAERAIKPADPSAENAADDSTAPQRKPAAAKSRKPVAPVDPMQLMAASVADAFSRQKAGVIACLNEHGADLEGAPQLKVRLTIDRNGAASDAELLPTTISSKPVAGCLRAAVKKMNFPRSDQPTTFSVPLLWRRK
jgi:hypothetical protein